MELLIFIGGVLLGYAIMAIHRVRERVHGIIHIDHETEQCIFSITSDEVSNRKKKIAVFVINHDAKISREKQSL